MNLAQTGFKTTGPCVLNTDRSYHCLSVCGKPERSALIV
ncbi:hypothetical protein BRDCF_p224 [Bacteroidales bacterium CF]|nr:hypothetical protein BRDCF_p224 [Bacteroidales bacterium CF]